MRPLHLASSRPAEASTSQLISRRAIYRFFRDTGTAGLDICLLSLADHLATYNGPGDEGAWSRLLRVVTTLFQHFFEQHSETVAPLPFLNGRDIMEQLQIAPGPEIGRLLRLLEEAQASGEITSHEEAVQFAFDHSQQA